MVKETDSKSVGHCLRRFESCCRRNFAFIFLLACSICQTQQSKVISVHIYICMNLLEFYWNMFNMLFLGWFFSLFCWYIRPKIIQNKGISVIILPQRMGMSATHFILLSSLLQIKFFFTISTTHAHDHSPTLMSPNGSQFRLDPGRISLWLFHCLC